MLLLEGAERGVIRWAARAAAYLSEGDSQRPAKPDHPVDCDLLYRLESVFLNEDRLAIQDWPVWHLTSKGKWMPGQMPPIPDAPLRKHYWRPFQIDWLDAVKVTVTVP